jgi:hypothetical protein
MNSYDKMSMPDLIKVALTKSPQLQQVALATLRELNVTANAAPTPSSFDYVSLTVASNTIPPPPDQVAAIQASWRAAHGLAPLSPPTPPRTLAPGVVPPPPSQIDAVTVAYNARNQRGRR